MKTKSKSRLAAMILSALAVVGIGGAALAQSDSSTTTQPQASAPADSTQVDEATEADEADEATEADEQSPSYTGSITAPDDSKGDGAEAPDDEAAEADVLAKLATLTPEQAEAAALAEVPGTAVKVELGNENGSVVYEVEIDTGSGLVEVKVDAGNGKVLHQEADNETDAAEANG